MTGISTLAQALNQINRLESQQKVFEDLSTQLTTGKKTQSFAGLDTDIIFSKRARANINTIDTYTNNITNVNRRIEQMDLSLSQIQEQANILVNSLTVSPAEGDYPDFEVIQTLASNIYDFVLDLVNTKDGDRFLFAGSDSDTQPITDTGLLSSFLGDFVPDENDLTAPPLTASGAIGQWGSGTITTEEFIAAYRGLDDTTLGYSAPLTSGEAGNLLARVDDNKQIDYTVLGNDESIREIITVLGVIKELPPPEFAPGALNDPTATTFPDDTPPFPPEEKQENFFAVLQDLGAMLTQAVDKVDDERFKLAQTQVQMDKLSEFYRFEKKAFQDTVAEVEDADVTEVAAKINSLQIQIEASYSVTATISQLSLVNFFRG